MAESSSTGMFWRSVCAWVWTLIGIQILIGWTTVLLFGGSYHVFVNDTEYCVTIGHQAVPPCRAGHYSETEKR